MYLRALKEHVEGLEPQYYLGDAAEAFANAAQVVFPSITTRLMCYAHVYKVSHKNFVICISFFDNSIQNHLLFILSFFFLNIL